MSGQAWSIMIVPATAGGGAAFQPDAFDAQQGDALKAQKQDLVSFNNKTDDHHHPWLTDKEGRLLFDPVANENLSDCIAPGKSSAPAYLLPTVTSATTVFYLCLNHPAERGTIEVNP